MSRRRLMLGEMKLSRCRKEQIVAGDQISILRLRYD